MVISHDRYLIERIADVTYALFGDGKLTNLPGGIAQYLERRAATAEDTGPLDLGEKAPQEAPTGLSSQEERELRKKMKALERKLGKADEEIEAAEAEIATMSSTDAPDFAAIGEKTQALGALKEGRDELEMQWLELGEELEG